MAIKLNAECKAVLDALKKNNGYIDDHDNKFHTLTQGPWDMFVVRFSRLRRPEDQELCPIFVCRGCSVNPFYLDDDGQVHLSTGSIGGVVIGGNIDIYNREHLENEYWSKDRLDFVYDPSTGKEEVA